MSSTPPRPYGLLAELTYRCPLHCPYCSNPDELQSRKEELTTDEWRRVMAEAAQIGAFHALLSGGEPLLRSDLPAIVAAARAEGLYTNLITSAVGLGPGRARELRDAGLDSVQISFQSDEEEMSDRIAGARVYARKREAAELVRELGFPLTLNVVLHRFNLSHVAGIIALAEEFGAERLELANTQYYGWALRNRAALLPDRRQLEDAGAVVEAAVVRLKGQMEILWVAPDYFGDRPKPCMEGWGRRYLTVNPFGDVLPCPTAYHIPGLRFENVRKRSLVWTWTESDSFNQFRGTSWMEEPCRSCDRREIDFGGCRCQASLLTGTATRTDPACALSLDRDHLLQIVENPNPSWDALAYRNNPHSTDC